jgi:hypothetical protein
MKLTGMNLDDAVKYVLEHGGAVDFVHRTGEIRFSHPAFTRKVTVNARRKDAPVALTSQLKKIEVGK